MRCPVCDTSMVILEYDEVEVDYCPTCHGCWLDRGELDLIVSQDKLSSHVTPTSFKRGKRRCPRCGKKMRVGYFPETEVEIDICPVDRGIWLDRGELTEIATVHGNSLAVDAVKNFFSQLLDHQLRKE